MTPELTNEQICIREVVRLVCSQTNYTEEEAIEKLEERNNKYLEVIKDYINPVRKPIQYTATVNQQIFKNIRGFLDSEKNNLDRRRDNYENAGELSCEKKIEKIFTNAITINPTKEQLTEQNKTSIINI